MHENIPDLELSFQKSGLCSQLGELGDSAWITEKGLADLFGYNQVTIKRAIARGELPAPVKLFNQRGWTAGHIQQHLEARLQKAAQEAIMVRENI